MDKDGEKPADPISEAGALAGDNPIRCAVAKLLAQNLQGDFGASIEWEISAQEKVDKQRKTADSIVEELLRKHATKGNIFWLRLIESELWSPLLDKAFANPDVIPGFLENDGILRCMDEGTPGGLRLAGSGILRERETWGFPNLPEYAWLHQFGIHTDLKVNDLLPNTENLTQLRQLKEKGIIRGVSAHADCGAAAGDINRILNRMGIPQNKIREIMKQIPKELIDNHAKLFSQTLAQALDVEYSYIPEEEMARPVGGHGATAFYEDMIGGFLPGVGFNPRKLGLPAGFVNNPRLSNLQNTYERLDIALNITFGTHGNGEKFTPENPFLVVIFDNPLDSQITDEVMEKFQSIATKYDNRVLVKKITPNIREDLERIQQAA